MGIRSLTVFMDGDVEIAVMYCQLDGYPTGHGVELAEFLEGKQIVNGLRLGTYWSILANGMPCLAAQVVAFFKDGPGDFYLYPAGTRNCDEKYIYTISEGEGGTVHMKATTDDPKEVLFEGRPEDFISFVAKNPDL